MDVVLPKLRQRIELELPFEVAFAVPTNYIPDISTDLQGFARQLDDARRVPSVLPLNMEVSANNLEPWDVNELLDLKA